MSRAIVTSVFLFLSAVVLWFAYLSGSETFTGSLLLNLGAEILGIVVTLAVVDWFLERGRRQERGRQLAWQALHSVENAVWVWQGGPRQLETDELLGILSAVRDQDPLPDFTQNLLLAIGTRSKQGIKHDASAVAAMPGLGEALEQLSRLSSMRDDRDTFPPRKVADILTQGISHLALLLRLSDERIPARLIRYRDPSLSSQERRQFGSVSSEMHRRLPSAVPEP